MDSAVSREAVHARSLLLERRCAGCAEVVPARLALRGGVCPHCLGDVHGVPGIDAEAVTSELRARWSRWRLPVYAVTAVSQALTGWVPVLPAVLMFVALVATHVFVVRQPLGWLGPTRRVATRFSLKLAIAVITVISLVVNVAVLPMLGANTVIAAIVGLAGVAAYVELSLLWIGNRLRREAIAPGLSWWELAIPGAALGCLAMASVGTIGAGVALLYVVQWMEIPGVSEVAAFLLASDGGG